jgi:toxin ParE1/3/4
MRRRDVVFRKRALRDLDEISKKLTRRSGSADVAARYLERILATCSRIGDAPEGGRPREDIRPGLRSWVFEGRMIIVYRLERRRVRIVRIVDGRRDYSRLLAPDRPIRAE